MPDGDSLERKKEQLREVERNWPPAPVDCVSDDTLLDVEGDIKPSVNGLAIKSFGVPYSELTRREQRLIDVTVRGQRKEIEQAIRSTMQNTMLDANVRLERSAGYRDKLELLMESMVNDGVELMSDNMEVTENTDFKKTRAGTVRRNLRHMKVLTYIVKTHTETEIALAKLQGSMTPRVINIKETNIEDNRVQTVTPDSVRDRLGKAKTVANGDGDE
jgi:hypothetical protein